MSNGQTALATINDQLADAIEDIQGSKPVGTCQAHEPIARSMILLLRGTIAQIDILERRRGLYWMFGVGLITGNLAALLAIVQLFRM